MTYSYTRRNSEPFGGGVGTKDVSILIVDDEDHICRLLATCLGTNYVCETASNAEEAVGLTGSKLFNLVMTDIKMPGASGFELCDHVLKNHPDTVVIMISAVTDVQNAIEAMKRGAFDYITKPFHLPQVIISVERALRFQSALAGKHKYERLLRETIREFKSLNDRLSARVEPVTNEQLSSSTGDLERD